MYRAHLGFIDQTLNFEHEVKSLHWKAWDTAFFGPNVRLGNLEFAG